jgi:hypothetical protein
MPELKGRILHHANTNTSPDTIPEPSPAQRLSPRTVQTYAQDWALFTDWCAATGTPDLPAAPDTVLRFFIDCPATRSTQRCRVAAIDHHHAGAGLAKPGESPMVRAALGRPVPDPGPAPPDVPDPVAAALRGLPSHGWTQGMFGRRDRCLLVLSQVGVPYQVLATLTIGDIQIANAAATVATRTDGWTVVADPDPVLCGPCAIARWVRVVDLAVTKITAGTVAAAVDKANPVTHRSPHLCRSTRPIGEATLVVPVYSSINQWGALPFPLHRLTPHSLSRRVRDLLAGNMGAHRHLPVNPAHDTDPEEPAPAPVVKRATYSRDDAQRAWARRRADLQDIAGVEQVLAEIEAQAKELERRTAAVLAAEYSHDPQLRSP